MPGRLRWPYVARDVVAQRPATVVATLYDTRRGYPALVLDGAAGPGGGRASGRASGHVPGPVSGWLLGFADEDADGLLDRLDRVEGPSYRRALVRTDDGTEAVTYEYLGSPDGFVRLDGTWTLDLEDER